MKLRELVSAVQRIQISLKNNRKKTMHCPEYVWEMKDLTVNSKIDIFQEKYTDSQNAQNMTRIFKIAKK